MQDYYDYMAKYYELVAFGFGYKKEDLLKNAKGVKVIRYGDEDFPFFNIYFLNDMLQQILEVLHQNYIPKIELANRQPGWINWSDYFEQPFYEFDQNYINSLPIEYLDRYIPSQWKGLRYEACFNEQERALATKLYVDWAVINEPSFNYIAKEYENLIKGKDVLGVLCRGTDMIKLKLKNHPIQPPVEDLIHEAHTFMKKLHCSYIYLATEDSKIYEKFCEEFPGKIIVNNREYIDKEYDSLTKDNPYIADVINSKQENNYLRGLQYLSSIILLSQCKGFVAGNCGGSEAALYYNEFRYEDVKVFNCGLY